MSRIAVITGTTHGIGVVTSRELARAGCTVVMLCRNDEAAEDGFELTFATNHLGPFLLTRLLLDRMTGRGRIVTVASRNHYKGRLGAPELAQVADRHARYNAGAAYARSKSRARGPHSIWRCPMRRPE